MVKVTVLAIGVAAGLPPITLGLAAAVMWQPFLILAGAPAWAVVEHRRRRSLRPGPDDEAVFLRSFAAELDGGASLRSALAVATDRAPRLDMAAAARMATAGLPAERVAASIEASLPVNGRLASAAWLLAASSGAPAAAVTQSLAVLAAEEGALRRERRALTAQARASAWVVGALPAVLLAVMLGGGRLSVADPALAPVLVAGLGLQIAGVAVVVWMLRRADR
jgi:Flp pilus assembly protein TadB